MIHYNDSDLEAIKILDSFLPQKIFDAHMHISLYPFLNAEKIGIEDYRRDTLPLFSDRYVRCTALATPTKELKNRECHEKTVRYFEEQLDRFPDCVGSVMVKPGESYEEIASHVKHPGIRGLKCYHIYADREDTMNADICEYLPESALAFANDRKMAVTLHLVKDESLADPTNLQKIKDIARNYPDLRLILAHAARAFASWTVLETVRELVPYENIFFDFAAVCESPAMIAILRAVGVSRCMWGSDYNVSNLLGKAVSLGSGFYWINENDLSRFAENSVIHPRHVITENLMAVREACILSDLSPKDLDDLFYTNACRVFDTRA